MRGERKKARNLIYLICSMQMRVFRYSCHFTRGVVFSGSIRQYFGAFQLSLYMSFFLPYTFGSGNKTVDANFASYERRVSKPYRKLFK